MRTLLLILFPVVIIGVLLATQDENLANEVAVKLPFIDAVWTGPVLWMIGGFFGVGFGLGYLAGLPGRVSASMRARKVEKQLGKTSDERSAAVASLNEASPPAKTARGTTEADEMKRLADEVARRTESTVRDTPPPPPSSTV